MERITSFESLHDQILEDTGKDLPIGTGTGLSITDPVKMFTHKNLGHGEADIINFFLRDYETVAWDVIAQEILVIGDKHIDCIELSVSESPDDMKDAWTEKYYFDITDCLDINKNQIKM